MSALDAALAAAVGAPLKSVMHLMDPRRIVPFESGGPPVWSVAFARSPELELHLTYGLSGRVDVEPAREALTYELSIAVPPSQGGIWAALLLRSLSHYVLTSRCHLEVGHHMDLLAPISRAPVGPAERGQMPETALTVVAVTNDPLLPRIDTPRGPVEVRRIYGLYSNELRLAEPWSVAGLVSLARERDPKLLTDLRRPSFAADAAFVRAAEEGSRRDGASFGGLPVDGICWERTATGYRVHLPGGAEARRIRRVIDARIRFGRNLLLHGFQPQPNTDVGLKPSGRLAAREVRGMLEVELPPDDPVLDALDGAGPTVTLDLPQG